MRQRPIDPPRPTRPAAAAYVPAIEGLRGLAALSVMLVHLYLMPKAAGLWPSGMPEGLALVIGTGGRGVELFFVISGYLIPASLRRHGSVGRFLVERILRIMPLYAVLHLVLFLAGPWLAYKFFVGLPPAAYAAAFAANLLFLAPLFDMPLAQQNGWSLTYEWLFYAWTAAMFVALSRRLHRLAAAALVAVALLAMWRFPPASYFAVGVALAFLDPRPRLGRGPGLVLGLACLAAVYGLCEYVSVFAGLPFAAVLFLLVLDPGSGFAGLMRARPLLYLGRVSYSLYLVHPFVLFAILLAVKRLHPPETALWLVGPAIVACGALASVAVSALTYEWIEVRLRRRLEGRSGGRPAVPALDSRGPRAGQVPS